MRRPLYRGQRSGFLISTENSTSRGPFRELDIEDIFLELSAKDSGEFARETEYAEEIAAVRRQFRKRKPDSWIPMTSGMQAPTGASFGSGRMTSAFFRNIRRPIRP